MHQHLQRSHDSYAAAWPPGGPARRTDGTMTPAPDHSKETTMNKRLTLKSLLSATALAVAALAGTPAWAADQAEVRPRLRDLRGLPPRGAVGRRRDQEAHRRPLRDPGLPGLAAGQGVRHQPGPDAGHGGHHLHRPGLRRAHLPAAGDRRRAVHVPRLRPLEEVLAGDLLKDLMEGYYKKGGNKPLAVTYYGVRHTTATRPSTSPRTWPA